MTNRKPETITRLLKDLHTGESGAAESLLPLVYDELHGLAAVLFSKERHGHTLQPTALVHEAWLKLAGHLRSQPNEVQNRKHFFIIAAKAMRQILIDHARQAGTQKRGEGGQRVTLNEAFGQDNKPDFDLVEFSDTLARLAKLNARHADIVEMRILGGLTIAETAEALGLSQSTIEADWFTAKAWLRTELKGTR